MGFMNQIMETVERLANDRTAPAELVDWACDRYDILTNQDGRISVRDLVILDIMTLNYDEGLYLLAHHLRSGKETEK